jgi:hypothetical protein
MATKKPRPERRGIHAARTEPAGKIVLYDQLCALNRHCLSALLALEECRPAVPKREWQYCRLLIEEARALASQSIVEWINEREIGIASTISRRRTAIEKQMFK